MGRSRYTRPSSTSVVPDWTAGPRSSISVAPSSTRGLPSSAMHRPSLSKPYSMQGRYIHGRPAPRRPSATGTLTRRFSRAGPPMPSPGRRSIPLGAPSALSSWRRTRMHTCYRGTASSILLVGWPAMPIYGSGLLLIRLLSPLTQPSGRTAGRTTPTSWGT